MGVKASVSRLLSVRGVLRFLVLLIILATGIELVVRIALGWNLPILPYYVQEGVPRLPSNSVMHVKFLGTPEVLYTTDRLGMRIAKAESDGDQTQLLVIGDSQALGYGLAFEKTFAAHVAQSQ
ncbi:MAG: hypothetical protein OEV08_00060, partial [Nitrospira sp.]|nr:hypothetical protein [Nitrospira sp.]